MQESADRFNEGKPRMGLLPADPLLEMARVLTMGADKYGDHNWRKGLKYLSVLDSMERHIAAFKKGQDHDEESNLHHMAHVMCNAAFIIQYHVDGMGPTFDDRYKVPVHAPMPGSHMTLKPPFQYVNTPQPIPFDTYTTSGDSKS